jgi:hypothetical protein
MNQEATKEEAIESVGRFGANLDNVSIKFRNDKDVVLVAVRGWGNALKWASKKLKNDRDVVLEAVKQDGQALVWASEELRDDKEVVLAAVKNNTLAILYASENLLNDKEIVIEAVKRAGWALQYASVELQNDQEVIFAAHGQTLDMVDQDTHIPEFSSPDSSKNLEVVNDRIKNQAVVGEKIGDSKSTRTPRVVKKENTRKSIQKQNPTRISTAHGESDWKYDVISWGPIALVLVLMGFKVIAGPMIPIFGWPAIIFMLWRGIGVGALLGDYAQNLEDRRQKRDQKRKEREEDLGRSREYVVLDIERRRHEQHEDYKLLRKEIEAMPQYKHWRQAVLQTYGRKCSVCGASQNIEVDHRYKSFYAIVKENHITNTVQAYECAELWDVSNGAPLCKAHHDETQSSIRWNSKN